jgi:hypothetical protein
MLLNLFLAVLLRAVESDFEEVVINHIKDEEK